MTVYKQFNNGLRLIVNRMEGLMSASIGVLVKTGSCNESASENGISHFIEHVMFKGTEKRTAFEISDHIDRIGAQINAFTSKEMTCYYTKSTGEHVEDSLEILSDIFFSSKFDKEELEKEKGVIIEEINMSEDTPEDICLDLLSKAYYGDNGLGQTILGPTKNIKRFSQNDVKKYMQKFYTADNVVISLAGDVDPQKSIKLVEDYFANKFNYFKSDKQVDTAISQPQQLYKSKKIEQSHIGFAMNGYTADHKLADAFSIANIILGGGMSSRLFQKIREELGLCYSIYSYASQYKDNGLLEIYAGVNTAYRDLAVNAIAEEVKKLKKNGITEQEFYRGKEQIKSAFIYSRESTASQMLLYGKYLMFLGQEYDYQKRIKEIENVSIKDVNQAIEGSFEIDKSATATVGTKRTPIIVK